MPERIAAGETSTLTSSGVGERANKEEVSWFLNGRELRALVSPDLSDGLLSTSQLDTN